MPCRSVFENAKVPIPPDDGFFLNAICFVRSAAAQLGFINFEFGVGAKLDLATSGGIDSLDPFDSCYDSSPTCSASPSAALDSLFDCSTSTSGVATGEGTAGISSSKLSKLE